MGVQEEELGQRRAGEDAQGAVTTSQTFWDSPRELSVSKETGCRRRERGRENH